MLRASIRSIAATILLLSFVPNAFAEGAVALGKGPAAQWFGVAINKSTVGEARADALLLCSRNGPNCSVLTTFRNTCVALTWGERPGRVGYAATGKSNINDARNAAIANCYSEGMLRCEIKYAGCDMIDEAELARQRRVQEERALQVAQQRRYEAELAAQQARDQERSSKHTDTRNSAVTSFSMSSKKALGLSIALAAGIFVVILKQGYPHLAGWTVVIMPAVSFLGYTLFGIEVKDHVTLAEWPLFAPVFGGLIVAGITWKLHA